MDLGSPVIDTQPALDEFVALASNESILAVDTEADSLHSYREKLCLIQLTLPSGDFLVDPLAGLDMRGLFDLLASRELIFHAADYDLRMLRRAGCGMPPAVFDTMLAARLTGRTTFGLAALVDEFFEVELGKATRKADWGLRPLTETMREYAMNDTRYLVEIRRRLEEKLNQLGRLSWLHEWCERTIQAASVPKVRDPDSIWRIAGANKLQPRALGILRELWLWRDAESAAMDVPAFKVLRNENLLDVAASFEATGKPNFPFRNPQRRQLVFEAYERGRELSDEDLPQRIKGKRLPHDPEFDSRFDTIKTVRDAAAEKLNLDPSLVASRSVLESLARKSSPAEAGMMRWQSELLELEHETPLV